jgi:hypothetical protein
MPIQSRHQTPLMLSLLLGMAVATGPATAQNLSETVQSGIENSATTLQDGRNFSFTLQSGLQNSASVEQEGRHNLSAVSQSGEGHEVTVNQMGDLNIHASTQSDTRLSPVSRSSSGSAGGITTHFAFEFD